MGVAKTIEFSHEQRAQLKKIYQKSVQEIASVTMPNGAILASPPGRRYPFLYPRDAVLILRVLNDCLKNYKQVRKSLLFIASLQKETGEWAQRYDKKGVPASYKPPQLDCNGLVLWMFKKYYNATGDMQFLKKVWNTVYLGMQFIEEHHLPKDRLIFSLNGIHEWPPIEAGFDIWVNSTCCAGIKSASRIASALGRHKEAEEWDGLAKEIWNSMSRRLVRRKSFISLTNHIAIKDPNVSEMGPYITNLVPPDDPRMRNTAKLIMKRLWDKELHGVNRVLYKYGLPARHNGGYGPYSMYTGWLAQYYTDLEQWEKVKQCVRYFTRYNEAGLLPEHVATKRRFLEWRRKAIEVGRYYKAGRKEEAERVMASKQYKERGMVYWVLPLTWGHAEFILFYHKLKAKGVL